MMFSSQAFKQMTQNGAEQLKDVQVHAESLTRQSLAQVETWMDLNKQLSHQVLDLGMQASATALNFSLDQGLKMCDSMIKNLDQVQQQINNTFNSEDLLGQSKEMWAEAIKPAQEIFSQMMGAVPTQWSDLMKPSTHQSNSANDIKPHHQNDDVVEGEESIETSATVQPYVTISPDESDLI